jgi:hypothetical protein
MPLGLAGGMACRIPGCDGTYFILFISPFAKDWKAPFDVDGILLHEGVHVWQYAMEYIAEQNPSREFEALGIQHIAHELKKAYRKAQR